MARSERGAPPLASCNERATPPDAPSASRPKGCVDFGAGRRCSLGRDRCGYRRCARALASAKIEQQRDSFQYFNSLLRADRSAIAANVWTARPFTTKRQARVKNYSNKIYSETSSKVGRVVLNALASNAAPPPDILAPSAILSSSVRALHGESATGLAFSGEADPPTAYIWSARRGETIPLKTRNSRVASRVPGYFF
jgi:hypothetical protein